MVKIFIFRVIPRQDNIFTKKWQKTKYGKNGEKMAKKEKKYGKKRKKIWQK